MTGTMTTSKPTLRKLGWGLIIAVFLIPVTAKLLVSEMLWSLADFALWGAMLALAGALGEGVLRVFRVGPALAGGMLAIGAGFLLVWVNLAVGFIGNEDNTLNLAYFAMLAIVLSAAFVARFRPGVMAVLMIGCAVAQVALLLVGRQEMGFEWMATGIFCLIWLTAAGLFRMAARGQGA